MINLFCSTIAQEVQNLALISDEEDIELTEKLQFTDFPFLEDKKTIRWIKQNRIIFIMRGLPGSGKSTLVKIVSKVYKGQNPKVCSADHYFINESGDYVFNPAFLKDAHKSSQDKMKSFVKDGQPLVIVDNTNVEHWEMRPYFMVWIAHAQCGNFRIFLSFRFYVKSIFGTQEVQSLPFLHI